MYKSYQNYDMIFFVGFVNKKFILEDEVVDSIINNLMK